MSWFSLGCIIGTCVHYFSGLHHIMKRIFKFKNKEHRENVLTYEESRLRFYSEYDRCNPITKAIASYEFIEYLKGKKIQAFLSLVLINFLAKTKTGKTLQEISKLLSKSGFAGNQSQIGASHLALSSADRFQGILNGIDMYSNQNLALNKVSAY